MRWRWGGDGVAVLDLAMDTQVSCGDRGWNRETLPPLWSSDLVEGVVGHTDRLLVLVVEDDPDISDLVTDILELDLDVRTTKAEDGERGLEMTKELRPDLVLLDIKLPKISGLEVARRLKADPRTRAIPLIALTSEPRDTTLAAGCDDHIAKPFDILDLVQTTRANLRPQACRRAA